MVVAFVGGASGPWHVERVQHVRGDPLAVVPRLSIVEGSATDPVAFPGWILRGVVSHERYVTRSERQELVARQAPLGRPEATRAALIPISKSPAWWALPQDERREIFEEQGHHIAASLRFLPAIARRLHHGRELAERFDFLTWFEYAPEHSEDFEELVGILRSGPEWEYVVAEIDVRLALR